METQISRSERIKAAMSKESVSKVERFFDERETVFATPGTPNHSANFYGMNHVCELSKADVYCLADCAAESWVDTDLDRAVEIILGDLQYENPEPRRTYATMKAENAWNPENHGNSEDFYTKGRPEECELLDEADGIYLFTDNDGHEFAVRETDTGTEFLGEDDTNEAMGG